MENSSPEKKIYDIAIDPASGKFIVADILPPRSGGVDVRPAMARSAPAKRTTTRVPSKQTTTAKKKQNTEVLDEWFRKEQSARIEKKPLQIPARSPRKRQVLHIVLVAVGLVAAGAYGASYYFASLHVVVNLQTQSRELTESIRVMTKPEHEADIPGELLELAKTTTETFSVSGTDDVRAHAAGSISIYNAFNSSPQVLVANTRFEAPDGQIYRTRESVTVPAAIITNGTLTPQSIDVKVWADQPGEEYNRDLTDFTIPGFKGSSRYKGFYARSKTLFTGGFIGTTAVVTQQDRDNAEELLERNLKASIEQELTRAVPEGFTLLDGASEITIDDKSCSAEVGDAVNEFICTISAEARSLLFRKEALDNLLIANAGLTEHNVMIHNQDDLLLEIKRRSIENGMLMATVQGPVVFVWKLDMDLLKSDIVASGELDALTTIFQRYAAIDRADVQFSPRWIRSIPKNSERIIIETNY